MRTLNTIQINADSNVIFSLAADILSWPKLLPHYRWVRRLPNEDSVPVFEMAALRTVIPVKWTSLQTLDTSALKIYYRHIAGATRGMWVEWAISERADGGCDVSIIHELSLLSPLVRTWLGKLIVSRFFVTHIADKTLEYIKLAAEGHAEVIQCGEER